jgi:hypothetical protein
LGLLEVQMQLTIDWVECLVWGASSNERAGGMLGASWPIVSARLAGRFLVHDCMYGVWYALCLCCRDRGRDCVAFV